MMKRLMILVAASLAGCLPVDAGNAIRAGKVSMDVPPLLHQMREARGFIFAADGWRLAWGQPDAGAGTTRLAVQGFSGSGDGRLLEGGVRVGDSNDPASVANCLTFGLDGGGARTLPDRQIGGVPFRAVGNSDAGMSQQLSVTSYRAVTDGTCLAIDRYVYASLRDIPEGVVNREDLEGALDDALASIQVR